MAFGLFWAFPWVMPWVGDRERRGVYMRFVFIQTVCLWTKRGRTPTCTLTASLRMDDWETTRFALHYL